jgi:hypothetical protein
VTEVQCRYEYGTTRFTTNSTTIEGRNCVHRSFAAFYIYLSLLGKAARKEHVIEPAPGRDSSQHPTLMPLSPLIANIVYFRKFTKETECPRDAPRTPEKFFARIVGACARCMSFFLVKTDDAVCPLHVDVLVVVLESNLFFNVSHDS